MDKVIAINLTANGWEVLVNGGPSPRFDRYARQWRKIGKWTKAGLDLLVIGPAKIMLFVLAMFYLAGDLTVWSRTSQDYQVARLSLEMNPLRHWPLSCNLRPAATDTQRHACEAAASAATADAQADRMRTLVMMFYVVGVLFSLKNVAQRRW